jgi:hypothetical protein
VLNGLDPIIIFVLKAKKPITRSEFENLPIAELDNRLSQVDLPPIPIYLSETLTGIFIQTESKNIDIETKLEGEASETLAASQKLIGSIISIHMVANKDSVGFTLLSAIADMLLPKVVTQGYEINYFHGPIAVFNGLIHSFAVNQSADSDLLEITLEISKGADKKVTSTQVTPDSHAASVSGSGATKITSTLPTHSTGASGTWSTQQAGPRIVNP